MPSPEKIAQMNSQLTESEERFRALVTATSDVVYRMSPDWSVMRQLEGGNFLSDTGEPISNWMEKYIHADDREKVREAIQQVTLNKSMFQLEHQVQRADGSIGWTFRAANSQL